MDRVMLERMIGAAVLVVLFVVFVPALLDGRDDEIDERPQIEPGKRSELIVLKGGDSVAGGREPEVLPAPEPLPDPESEPEPEPVARNAEPAAAEQPDSAKTALKQPARKAPAPDKQAGRSAPEDGFAVQLGSFSSRENAVGFAGSVQNSGYPVFVVKGNAASGAVYRVYAGPRETRKDAEKLAERLSGEGQSVMIVDLGAGNE